MYNLQLFNEIDDIDHFTLAVRKGKDFDRDKAVWFIKRYSSYYPFVEKLSPNFNKSGESFDGFTDKELYAFLIKIRDEMAKNTFSDGVF